MRDTRNPYENRRAKIVINPASLARMLSLPDGLAIVGIYGQHDPASICIVVEGDQLDPQPLDCELPPLGDGFWHTWQTFADGHVYVRWEWQPAEPSPPVDTRQGA